jgi:drug/metabolite transporter (DMT)-like permease
MIGAVEKATPSSRSLGLILGLIAVILLSGSLPANRAAVADLSPWFVVAGRATIGGLVAIGILAVRRPAFPKGHAGRIALIAICLVVAFPLGLAVASVTVPASHGAVVLGLLPLATAIAAVPLAGDRPSLGFWALCIIGALLVAVFALRGGGDDIVTGDIYLAIAIAVCGVGFTLSGVLARTVPGWEVIAWPLVFVFPFAAIAAIILWPADLAAISLRSWLGLLYAGIVVQFIAYAFLNAAMALGGVARIGQLQVLQPLFTILIAATVLGELIDLETVLFAVAVVIVVALGRRATIREHIPTTG